MQSRRLTPVDLNGTHILSTKTKTQNVSDMKWSTCRRETCCKCCLWYIDFANICWRNMPPGVPHWVLRDLQLHLRWQAFYASSTIRSLVISIIHAFLMGVSVTNEFLIQTRTLLYQLMVFWSLRLDKTDVDGKSIVNFWRHVFIRIWIRGPYPGHFFRPGFFGRIVSRRFYYPLTCIRPPLLPQEVSSCQPRFGISQCQAKFLFPPAYFFKEVLHRNERRGCLAFLCGGPHDRRIRSCCTKSSKRFGGGEWRWRPGWGWDQKIHVHRENWRHSEGNPSSSICLLFEMLVQPS